jgi:hypothetical protein
LFDEKKVSALSLRRNIKCTESNCQEAMLIMYTCLKYGNRSMPMYQMLNQCELPTKTRPFVRVPSTYDSQNRSTYLTLRQHQAVLQFRFCIQEKCNGIQKRVIYQTLTTILFTAISETLFEKGINFCSRRCCSATKFAFIFTVVDILLLSCSVLLLHFGVETAYVKLVNQSTQRCIFVTPVVMKLEVFKRYIPVLSLSLLTSFLSVSVQEWVARRNMLLKQHREEDSGGSGVCTGAGNDKETSMAMINNPRHAKI